MYIRVTSTPNSPRKSVKVVESVREGFSVKQKMVKHIGVASNEAEIEKLKRIGAEFIAQKKVEKEKESKQLSLLEPISEKEYFLSEEKKVMKKQGRPKKKTFEDVTEEHQISLAHLIEEKRIVEGFHEVAGHVYKAMGYEALLRQKKDNELLKDLVLMRLAQPTSKLKTQQILEERFSKTHDLDRIYRLLDKVYLKISDIKKITFDNTRSLLPEKMDILFFDCTTLYFESTDTDELREFGYSKDHRFNTTQVVLALATNGDGLPIGYELFEGNKAEVKTLLLCLEDWKKNFSIERVCFVADRAMMSDENLSALEKGGHQYIVAAKLRNLPNPLVQEILSEKNYKTGLVNEELAWTGEFEYRSRRLIVSYKTARAKRDAYQRSQVIQKLKKRIGEKGNTEKLITNQGVKKYTRSTDSTTEIDAAKVERDSGWDGLHGVITNISDQDVVTILGRYACLWKIEESFRINKHTLSMRPIYHFKPTRIRAHIAICYLAFSLLRHMEYRVKLSQKITLNRMLDELMRVQASFYRHIHTQKLYRMPSSFSHIASKIYNVFNVKRNNHAQIMS